MFRRYETGAQAGRAYDDSDLVIALNGGAANAIVIHNQFYSNDQVETLRFSDASTLDLTALTVESHGTAGADNMDGIVSGGSIDDIMFGFGGDDDIEGKDGDDVLRGGDGNDDVDGDDGNDVLYGDAGDDILRGDGGDDVFVYSEGLDTLYDSGSGNDLLKITGGVNGWWTDKFRTIRARSIMDC